MVKYVSLLVLCFLQCCSSRGTLESKILQGSQGEIDVIVFSSTDCPIANALAPELERIHKDLMSKGGELFLVHIWEGRTFSDANEHAREYGLTMEVLVDNDHELVNRFHATVTPEAVVVTYDASGKPIIVYQGLINNLFDSPGNRRDKATKHYVRDAIDAAIDGAIVTPSYRKPTGCIIEQMK
mgnify:CR=1 FL=1|jgi:hypothetical protein